MLRILLTASCLILLVQLSEARSIPAVEGLEALRKAFSGINDFTAEISQEKRLTLMKRTMTMNGSIRFRKPDLFYMEIGTPYASRMVLRDGTIEQVIGSSTDRSKLVLPPEQGLKKWFSRLMTPITVVPDGLGVSADLTGQIYSISITPTGKGQIRELIIVFLEDGTMKKLVITEQNGDRSSMVFKKVRKNTGLSDREFRLD
jgi:outer membrane lipoprotein carrier protein